MRDYFFVLCVMLSSSVTVGDTFSAGEGSDENNPSPNQISLNFI